MSDTTEKIVAQALQLPPIERAELIEELLSSFEFPSRRSIDKLWAKEVEDRIDAYERGHLGATPAKEVFDKISRK
ncbi:MAG: addiction module protein [Aliifodinibius sp.]|nr:addiction module protein [candidate division Zixibacteria bacterium]NIT57552.1 addiction module protein [Fodinibius sp.]NIU14380.1 addiction module protein [candidate division Zixibacteria bacterium]NIV06443.1 addiction module protein [candidate division Zixibacteria bacterium]NIY26134.1 addiction module protein [Fodinibius sp.]